MGVAAGFLSSLVPAEGQPVLVLALAVLILVLAGYCGVAYTLTATRSRVGPATLVVTGAAGVTAGLAWSVLMPFNASLAVPHVTAAISMCLVLVGAPTVAPAVAIRPRRIGARRQPAHPSGAWPDGAGHATLAGTATGGVAGRGIPVAGPGTAWAAPRVPARAALHNEPPWPPPRPGEPGGP